MRQNTKILRTNDLVNESCSLIADAIRKITSEIIVVGLSGGSTPAAVYPALAKADLPWHRLVFTFGDERAVPPDDAASNFRMASEKVLNVAIQKGARVVRIPGELDPVEAAKQTEEALRDLARVRGEEVLRHDILLLGLGDDGHTASLFPHTPAIEESERWIVENPVLKLGTTRMTFTYKLINAAKLVVFLVNDLKKERVIQEILGGEGNHPAGGVAPADGEVFWLLGHPAT